ncbi:MAG: TonB-dependent receptor [Acidobacteriaceae bacterium]|jgi:iron complex outermembrane receptor protein
MNSLLRRFSRIALCAVLLLPIAATIKPTPLHAQSSVSLTGTVFDPRGVPLPGASVAIKNEGTGAAQRLSSDGQGKYSFANLAAGSYTIQVDASGFNTSKRTGVQLASGQPTDVPITLELGNASEEITVEASEANSVAAALAPMDALLEEHSARTEITQSFIANYTSPLADYGEAVEMAPGTFTTNGNGPGLGQSKTYFRGFPDGDYDIDFDGIPFYDTNTPTHHSWAFFPSQWIGGIDFDRSPGTASTIGPTPFGGSIHMLSRDVSPVRNIRGGISYGSWGTLLADFQYDSGSLGTSHKGGFELDVQHMDSKGYQTNNFQNRNAGYIKAQYKFSDNTVLSGFSGVVYLHANTPSFSTTRCQMYGAPTDGSYSCSVSTTDTTPLPYTGAGIRFYLAPNTDPVNYLDYQYNRYQVPTDFEYVDFKTVLPLKINLDFKPYTYDYDNAELYTNSVPITESTTVAYNGNPASTTWYGTTVHPCNVGVTKKGVTALPCGIDKYNSYRKYGETLNVNQTSKLGILRAGVWYEWARTNRHQYPSDPLNGWADQPLPKFAEQFWTNSYQPFVEYEFHPLKKLSITPGVKFAYYTISTKQFADDGATIGGLGTNNPASFISNNGSYYSTLPSIDANYRIRSNWSAYAQLSTGSIVPPSSTFDFSQGTSGLAIPVATLPKQQHNTTWQGGTVFKLKRVTLDLDAFHIRFQSGFSSETNAATSEPVFFPQPSSISKGLEGQSNIYVGHGLSVYLNATVERAYYTAFATIYPSSGANAYQYPLNVATPSGYWVQQTPSDTEAEGVSYLRDGFDVGLFNKRVGQFYLDNNGYHNQATISPFDITNTYINYTVRNGSRFDQTKIRLSVNNLFDLHNVTGLTLANSVTGPSFVAANGQTYTDPFNATVAQTPISGADNVSIFAGRSIVLSVTFGFNPKH